MARSNAITKSCEACGAAFQAKAADIARGWGRFCSKSCKAKKPKPDNAGMTREAWLIEYTSNGEPKRAVHLHNAIADYRQIDPAAVVTRLDDTPPELPAIDSRALASARKAYHNATGIGTSKTGMFAALKAAREPQEGHG